MKIGDYINLVRDNKSESKYNAKILDIFNDHINISIPINDKTNKSEWLLNGTTLKAYIKDNGEIQRFNTKIIGKNNKENVPFLQVMLPKEGQRRSVQRRNFVRVDTDVDVAIHPNNPTKESFNTICVNLSAGGLAIILPTFDTLSEGDTVTLWLVLPMSAGEINYVMAKAKVIRRFEEKGTLNAKASLAFESLGNNDQQSLLKYCFERQIYLKKAKGIK